MSIPTETRLFIREQANFACEYCGVSEIDSGGELTIDHFLPKAHGGSDDTENLLYCCVRCNQYKADYWPKTANAPSLWNPRTEAVTLHLLTLTNGMLYPITPTGEFTIQRLRLNRPALIAYRLRKQHQNEEAQILTRYREIVVALEELQKQQFTLIEEQRALLNEQRQILRLLLNS